jgi:hypothetical protein
MIYTNKHGFKIYAKEVKLSKEKLNLELLKSMGFEIIEDYSWIKKKESPMETMRSIRFEFTVKELDEMKTELATITTQLRSKEEEKRAIASQLKSEIDALIARTNLLAEKINTGYEYKNVLVVLEKDFERKEMRIIQKSTGDVLETRPLTDEEMQSELFEEDI